jgi:hypothetical protein
MNSNRLTADTDDASDDWVPIYDRSTLDGIFMACGTSGNQFKNGPLAGQFLRALVDAADAGIDHGTDSVQFPGERRCGCDAAAMSQSGGVDDHRAARRSRRATGDRSRAGIGAQGAPASRHDDRERTGGAYDDAVRARRAVTERCRSVAETGRDVGVEPRRRPTSSGD